MLAQTLDVEDIVNWTLNEIALSRETYWGPPYPREDVETVRPHVRKWKLAALRRRAAQLCEQASLQASTTPSWQPVQPAMRCLRTY